MVAVVFLSISRSYIFHYQTYDESATVPATAVNSSSQWVSGLAITNDSCTILKTVLYLYSSINNISEITNLTVHGGIVPSPRRLKQYSA